MRKRYPIGGVIGCVLTGAVILIAIFGPLLVHFEPNASVLQDRLLPPAGEGGHLLGTDQLGRDILSRIVHGARTSLTISVISVLASMVIGTALGLIAGYYEGVVDALISRLLELQMAFPTIVLALMIAALSKPGVFNIITILIVTGWIVFTRMVRSAVISLKNEEYIQAAEAVGCSDLQIIVRHILPAVIPLIAVLSTLEIGRKIILESTLSYLGVGLQPPAVSWGQMLYEGQNYLAVAWWTCLFSGLAPALTVLGINLFGDWLREKLDPKAR